MKRNYFAIGMLLGLGYGFIKHPFGCSVLLILAVLIGGGVVASLLTSFKGTLILFAVVAMWTGAYYISKYGR